MAPRIRPNGAITKPSSSINRRVMANLVARKVIDLTSDPEEDESSEASQAYSVETQEEEKKKEEEGEDEAEQEAEDVEDPGVESTWRHIPWNAVIEKSDVGVKRATPASRPALSATSSQRLSIQ